MGMQVHAPALRDLTAAQRRFLEAMAAVAATTGTGEGGDVVAIGDIAEHMKRTVTSLSTVRQQLLHADLIEVAGHGLLRPVVPYLAEFLLATDPLGRVD